MSRETALSRRARERPEAPFVFFRGRRGQFVWLSYRSAAGPAPDPSDRDGWRPIEVTEFLDFAASVTISDSEYPAELPASESSGERDVWISWRPLSVPEEAALARWAIRSDAAVLVERHQRLPVDLFSWARPTLLSAPAVEVDALLDQLERDAPNWLRSRWFHQRFGRLRRVLIEGAPGSAAAEIEARLRRLDPACAARVVRFPNSLATALV